MVYNGGRGVHRNIARRYRNPIITVDLTRRFFVIGSYVGEIYNRLAPNRSCELFGTTMAAPASRLIIYYVVYRLRTVSEREEEMDYYIPSSSLYRCCCVDTLPATMQNWLFPPPSDKLWFSALRSIISCIFTALVDIINNHKHILCSKSIPRK